MKLLKYILLISVTFICCVSKSIAVERNKNSSTLVKEQQAADKYQRDELARYKAFLEKKAKQGDLRSQTDLGDCYKNGLFGQNIPEAIKWYTMAANQGDVDAQYNLGLIYADVEYKSIDDVKALKWFTEAANQGDKRAKIFLAFLYKDGRKGIAKDKTKADKYAKTACEDINYSSSAALHPDSLTGQCLMYNDFKGLDK